MTTKTLNTRLNSTRKSLTSTRRNLSRLSRDLGTLSNRLKSGEGSIALLLGAAPQLVSGLQTLGNAVRNDIAPGLLALKSALEKDVQPALIRLRDEVGPGLTRLGTAYTSTEYGQVGLFVGASATPAGGLAATSPDIPDNGSPAVASLTLPVPIPAAAGAPVPVVARGIIRSSESDGAATGAPAGLAGALITATCVGDEDTTNGHGTGCGPGAVIPIGGIACTAGPPAPTQYTTPAGPKNLPLTPIQQKSALTADPSNTSTDITGAVCNLPHGGTYNVQVQGQFVDIPSSAAPDAAE